jgi:predicted secreted protein
MNTKNINNMKTLIVLLCTLLFNNCEKQNNDIDYQISINDTIDIELEANWSTGYSWYWLNKADVSIVDTLKREYREDTNRRGATGVEIWSFIGKQKGECTITLVYKRAYQTNSEYENRKDFLIVVK